MTSRPYTFKRKTGRKPEPRQCDYLMPHWDLIRRGNGERLRCSNMATGQVDGRWLCGCHAKKVKIDS